MGLVYLFVSLLCCSLHSSYCNSKGTEQCISPDTGFNLAHHDGALISPFNNATSMLDIFEEGRDVQDALVGMSNHTCFSKVAF